MSVVRRRRGLSGLVGMAMAPGSRWVGCCLAFEGAVMLALGRTCRTLLGLVWEWVLYARGLRWSAQRRHALAL